jgi:von Willebrand factor type A domain/Putative Flp pilus-assembly TadE/G-like
MIKLNQKGSVLIFLTLAFALLGTFVGFAVDFGRAYLEKARMSRLVDAAALAAAKTLQGQAGFEDEATRAACDSMEMNGAPVVMNGTSCVSTNSDATYPVTFFDAPVQGGPPIRHVRVEGHEPMPTTFLRFLGWMVPGDFSKIDVAAAAEAGPERPVDLMLVLDRSGSMSGTKIAALKTTVNEFLDNNFTGNDRIGMVSFAWRGCGNAAGQDNFAANICQPDVPMADATSANINTLKNRVNLLTPNNGATNTMEALRTARVPIAAAFNDATRAATRKVVLLITDGKPTAMRRDNDTQCKQNPKTGAVVSAWNNGSFPNGCLMDANDANGGYATRSTLSHGSLTNANGSSYFLDTISCFRSLHDCDPGGINSNGVMYESDLIRNCGASNAACAAAGAHDVLVFAIGIGQDTSGLNPNQRFDKYAKCMLLRAANGTELLNTGNNTLESINTVCTPPPPTYSDNDTYAELRNFWPCGSGPCINSTQEKGKVYFVDQTGNVQAQMEQVFKDIAATLKLRLTL